MIRRILCFLAAGLAVMTPVFVARAEGVPLTEADGAKSAVLMELSTNTRLWSKQADERFCVAGLGKLPAILTLCQSFDDGTLSESAGVRISERSAKTDGPTAFWETSEDAAAADLIKSAVMISAGDSIVALGEHAFGSEGVFLENINTSLRRLGLSVTLTDTLGTGVQFSAWELAVLGKAAASSKTFTRYSALYLDEIVHADGRVTELVSANRLLKSYGGCGGVMTGSSQEDGYCGVFYAERGGMRLVSVVIGSTNASERAAAATALLDYGFSGFRAEEIVSADKPALAPVEVRNAVVREVELYARESVSVVREAKAEQLKVSFELPDYLEAPLFESESVGFLIVSDETGAEIKRVALYVKEDVEAFGFADIIMRILGAFLS